MEEFDVVYPLTSAEGSDLELPESEASVYRVKDNVLSVSQRVRNDVRNAFLSVVEHNREVVGIDFVVRGARSGLLKHWREPPKDRIGESPFVFFCIGDDGKADQNFIKEINNSAN